MTSYEIVEFLDSLPKTGVIELSTGGGEIYVIASQAQYQAVGDSGLRIDGEAGYGNIATVDSIMLIDAESIHQIRHTRGTEE